MDKFEERYRLGEIHRGRMGKKHGWGFNFTRKISADTVYKYLKHINNINDLNYLRSLILSYCEDIDTNDFDSMSIEGLENDVLNNNVEDVDYEEITNLEDELGIDLEQLSVNVYNKEGRNYTDKIAKFINKNYKNCEILRKLYVSILIRIDEVKKTYETSDERYDRVNESLDDALDDTKYNINRAFDLFDKRGGYDDNYGHGFFGIGRKRVIKSLKKEINKLSYGDTVKLYDYTKQKWLGECMNCSEEVINLLTNINKNETEYEGIKRVIYPYIEDHYHQLVIENIVNPYINIIKNNLCINDETLAIYNLVSQLKDNQECIKYCYNIIDNYNRLCIDCDITCNKHRLSLTHNNFNKLQFNITIEESDLNILIIDELLKFIGSILRKDEVSASKIYSIILNFNNLSKKVEKFVQLIKGSFDRNDTNTYFSLIDILVNSIHNILSNIIGLSHALKEFVTGENLININANGLLGMMKNIDCYNIIVILLMCNDYTYHVEEIVTYLDINDIEINDIIKTKPKCNNVIDNHSGFNHRKYGKSRGNLHHLLMNEQSEYF